MVLLLAEMFLPERRAPSRQRPKQPRRPGRPPAFRRSAGGNCCCWLFCANVTASPASALREYKAGNYTNALQEFEQLAQVKTNDLRLVFNAGDGGVSRDKF